MVGRESALRQQDEGGRAAEAEEQERGRLGKVMHGWFGRHRKGVGTAGLVAGAASVYKYIR